MKIDRLKLLLTGIATCVLLNSANAQEMDKLWGESVVKLRAEDATKGQLFEDGNYAMFIHWGIYSNLANLVEDKTYYGIGEWIMNPRMAGIPPEEYRKLANEFNPDKFDALAVAQLAKDAGMKYIIITSKHHDGFAMYHSKSNKFNIVDATPSTRDPMKDLAKACKEVGIGFGFYYSHNQDWTFPGGNGGPTKDAEGNDVDFDYYYKNKCLPQVKEITTEYGPIEIVWFDTPGQMPKKYVEELVQIVNKNQPNALICGRAGHGLGDYLSIGDMEVPIANVEGLWETVDTTNDSWAYAYYDENWKTPALILQRVIATVARGGTYMLNIGPRGDGSVPKHAVDSLREAGKWIKRYPQVVYGTQSSPWQHPLPWGDVVVKENKLFLTVNEWPQSGELYLPGLKTGIKSAKLLKGSESEELKHEKVESWVKLTVPFRAPEKLVSVIEIELEGAPEASSVHGIDPQTKTEIQVEFSEVTGGEKKGKRWMEKFGEWNHVNQVTNWTKDTKVTFDVDVLKPGNYEVSLTYSGEGRVVWGVGVEGGEFIQNQKNSSSIYQSHSIGWLKFDKPGPHKVNVTFLDKGLPLARGVKPDFNPGKTASLKAIEFTPID